MSKKVKFSTDTNELSNEKIDNIHEEMMAMRDARVYNANCDRRNNEFYGMMMSCAIGVGVGVMIYRKRAEALHVDEWNKRLMSCIESVEEMMKKQ